MTTNTWRRRAMLTHPLLAKSPPLVPSITSRARFCNALWVASTLTKGFLPFERKFSVDV
ncbi:hypothetical protein [Paraburkholderia franconis]|uniref:hypothetical protein n=1 Tax=Paraburkholderia franconis TaxID=2654983 RepID=UPI00187B9546|nr:hypothetical protein [Paraburkholderia franconis]